MGCLEQTAAGRESTICDAETTGLAGGVGVVAGRDAGAESAISGTADFFWETAIVVRLPPGPGRESTAVYR